MENNTSENEVIKKDQSSFPGIIDTFKRGLDEVRRRRLLGKMNKELDIRQQVRRRVIRDIGMAAREHKPFAEEAESILDKLSKIDGKRNGYKKQEQDLLARIRNEEKQQEQIKLRFLDSEKQVAGVLKEISIKLKAASSDFKAKRRELRRHNKEISKIEKLLEESNLNIEKADLTVTEQVEQKRLQQSALKDRLPVMHKAMEPISNEVRFLKKELKKLNKQMGAIKKEKSNALRRGHKKISNYHRDIHFIEKKERELDKLVGDLGYDLGCLALSKEIKTDAIKPLRKKLDETVAQIRVLREEMIKVKAESRMIGSNLMSWFYFYSATAGAFLLVIFICIFSMIAFRGFGTGIVHVETMLYAQPVDSSTVFYMNSGSLQRSGLYKKLMKDKHVVKYSENADLKNVSGFDIYRMIDESRYIVGCFVPADNVNKASFVFYGSFPGSEKALVERWLSGFKTRNVNGSTVYDSGDYTLAFLDSNLIWAGHRDLLDSVLKSHKDKSYGLKSNRSMRKLIRSIEKEETFWLVCQNKGHVNLLSELFKSSATAALFETLESFAVSFSFNGKIRGFYEGYASNKETALKVRNAVEDLFSSYFKLIELKDEKVGNFLEGIKYSVDRKRVFIHFNWKRKEILNLCRIIINMQLDDENNG